MIKSTNNRAWFFVIPALLLLGFVAVIPLIMVVNYSFHDIITLRSKTWVGFEWYREILHSSRFWESLGRSLIFSAIILIIEIPLGIAIALSIPKKRCVSCGMFGCYVPAVISTLEYDCNDLACIFRDPGENTVNNRDRF